MKIFNIKPQHDYPVGLIHPYWARKPLNIIENLIHRYSKPGDTILDPFMGSGTSIIASLKQERNAIGSDINPISILLVKSILSTSVAPDNYKFILKNAMNNWSKYAINLYKTSSDICVEREYFLVNGSFIDSKFSLTLKEAKIKPIKGLSLKGKTTTVSKIKYINELDQNLISNPLDFESIIFNENTRIAIHRGTKASDLFTNRNIVFINYAKNYIEHNDFNEEEKNFLKLFLSSMIPMLRLSDQKASSQWPYWRPKNKLTSRNPVLAIKRRNKSFQEAIDWVNKELNKEKVSAQLYHCSANEVGNKLDNKIDLIITDPPYADHAPYLEYSDLYWSIISGERTKPFWGKEIVKTNAIGRENDSSSYEDRLTSALISTLSTLKQDGYFVFFYLDKNIKHWAAIKKAIKTANCITEEVIALPKQRRSMKTVTSPGKTLDGDLIIICKKTKINNNAVKYCDMESILNQVEGNSYFQRFHSFIKLFLTYEILDFQNYKFTDISRIL